MQETLTIGQRVVYKGDMANASGKGAIVAVDHNAPAHRMIFGRSLELCTTQVDVILDDGRSIPRVSAQSIGGEFHDKTCRFMLADGVASENELAALRAGADARVATQKAMKAAAETALATARNEARAAGLKLGLMPIDEFQASGKRGSAAAHNLRAELKAAGIKASVKQRDTGSLDVTVARDDFDRAEAISRKYQGGDFNGMTDSYEYRRNAWGDVFGDVRYVFTRCGSAS